VVPVKVTLVKQDFVAQEAFYARFQL